MTIWWLVLILALIGSLGIGFIWLIVALGKPTRPVGRSSTESLEEAAEHDVTHIFDQAFREELRNRGRLHFEKVIGENAMFLQQDLRLTTSEVNEYMKSEITQKLKEEFTKYEQSIMDAKQLAVESIEKTNAAIDQQRKLLSQEVQAGLLAEKQQIISRFESNMAEIVNHYVLAAIGDQIDLEDQMDYILSDLERNKKDILEDIKNGA